MAMSRRKECSHRFRWKSVVRQIQHITLDPSSRKGRLKHFMLKEIYEQPAPSGHSSRPCVAGHRTHLPEQMEISEADSRPRKINISPAEPFGTPDSRQIHDRNARAVPVRGGLRQRVATAIPSSNPDDHAGDSKSGETADTIAAQRRPSRRARKRWRFAMLWIDDHARNRGNNLYTRRFLKSGCFHQAFTGNHRALRVRDVSRSNGA